MTSEYLSRRSFLKIRELAGDSSPPAIAAEVGLSVETVVAVIEGRRQPSRIVVDDDHPLRDEMLTAQRCAGCGALVFTWPCLGCAMAEGHVPLPPQRLSGAGLKYKRQRALVAAQQRSRSPTHLADVA